MKNWPNDDLVVRGGRHWLKKNIHRRIPPEIELLMSVLRSHSGLNGSKHYREL